MKIKKDRKQIFIELVAQNITPYQAAIKAGYSMATAKNKSQDMVEKWLPQIESLKPIAKQVIQEKFKYSVQESFRKLNEIQELALLQDIKGNYNNLAAAIKAEELKGRMYGVYELDNSQKMPDSLSINVFKKED